MRLILALIYQICVCIVLTVTPFAELHVTLNRMAVMIDILRYTFYHDLFFSF